VTEDYTKEVKKFHSVPLYSLSSNPHSVVAERLSAGSKDVQQLSQLLGFGGYKVSWKSLVYAVCVQSCLSSAQFTFV